MQIRAVKAIKNFGIYSDWTSDAGGHEHQFGRQTLAFGHNGAGKSTLARLLAEIGLRQAGGPTEADLNGLSLELLDGATPIPVNGDDERIPPIVVFNRGYVEANLGQAFVGGEHATALYVLGAKDVKLEGRIAGIEEEIESLNGGHAKADAERKAASKAFDELRKTVRDEVIEILGLHLGTRYNTAKYKVDKATALMKAGGVRLDPQAEQQAKDTLGEREEDLPGAIPTPVKPAIDGARAATAQAISLSVTGEAISALAADAALQAWVQEGQGLHEERQICAYCDTEITKDRRVALDGHFNDSYRRSNELIETAEVRITLARSTLDDLEDYSKEHRHEQGAVPAFVEEHEDDLAQWFESWRSYLGALAGRLAARKDDRFTDQDVNLPDPPSWQLFEDLVRAVNEEITHRESRRTNLGSSKQTAEKQLLGHIAARYQDSYTRASVKEKSFELEVGDLLELLDNRKADLADAEAKRGSADDGQLLAKELTADLVAYLGRSDLTVAYRKIEERGGFQFLRAGHPATRLSEGEQTAIALLYFLCSLRSKDHADDLGIKIVVIDDPVSSLDQNALLSAVAFMQERLGNCGSLKCAQLILLTHNFTFYRLYKRSMQDKLRDTDAVKANGVHPLSPKAALLDLRVVEKNGKRVPTIRNPGPKMERTTSDYANHFELACDAILPEREDLALVCGNVTRRLLETFLAFKYPETDNFANAAKVIGEAHSLPSETIARITHALNDQSHRKDLDLHAERHVSDLVQDIRCTLKFIRQVDPEHFDGMKKVTGGEPDLGGVASAGANA